MLAQVCPPLHSSRRLANIRSNTFVPLAFHICKTTRIPHSLHIENCGVVLHVSGGNSLNSRRLPYRLGVYLVAPGSPHNSSLTTLLSSNSAQKQRVLCVIHVRTLRLLSHLLCGVSVRLWPTLRIIDNAITRLRSVLSFDAINSSGSLSLITSIAPIRLIHSAYDVHQVTVHSWSESLVRCSSECWRITNCAEPRAAHCYGNLC